MKRPPTKQKSSKVVWRLWGTLEPAAPVGRVPSCRTPKRAEVERGGVDSSTRELRLSEARARGGRCPAL